MSNSLLSVGQAALNNFQVALNVHGSNLANSSTEGYSRRGVNFATQDQGAARLGLGARIQSIVRSFDAFLERRYLEQNPSAARYDTIKSNLQQVQTLFNSANGMGVSDCLDNYMASLERLSAQASNAAVRNQALADASSLAELLRTMRVSLDSKTEELNQAVAEQVTAVNSLLGQLADVNKAIAQTTEDSAVRDRRDQLLRELSGYIDVRATFADNGQVRLCTAQGQSLVDGESAYSFVLTGPHAQPSLSAGSGFDGRLYFEGASASELTLKFLSGGDASGGATAARFQVSLDGGRTWVKDASGNVATYAAGDSAHKVEVNGVSLWFGQSGSPSAPPSTLLKTDDKFTVMAKAGVSWVTAAGGLVNVTPLAGNDAANRLSGGSLAGLLTARDEYVGSYAAKLDAFAKGLIWNMNRVHSQGAGLTNFSRADGEYAAADTSAPLGSLKGLPWGANLQKGNVSLALYDAATGKNLSVQALDFSTVTPGKPGFDPSVHSLENVRDAVNASYGGKVEATIQNGKLSLKAADGVAFQFAEDTSGLLAGLGLNTLFSGTSAGDVAVSRAVAKDPNRLCCGHVNGNGEVTRGDNANALALAALAKKGCAFRTVNGTSVSTLQDYMTTLCSKVGSDVESISFQHSYAKTLSNDIMMRRESVSGVSIDEEVSRIMQYQQCYQAASKLIKTANDMFDIVMSLK